MATANLVARISGDARGFHRTMREVRTGAKAAFARLAVLGATGMVAGMGAWAAALKRTASLGDDIGKMAKRTGFGVDELQRLKHAAELSGTNLEGLEKGARRMQSSIFDLGQGLMESIRAFDALGLTYDDLQGKSPDRQFAVITEALAGVRDASVRAAVAQDIFGRSGTQLLPMLSKGVAGLRAMKQEADGLGIVMTPAQIAAAEKFQDTLLRIRAAFRGAFQGAIADQLDPVADTLMDMATNPDIRDGLGELVRLTGAFAESLRGIAIAIKPVAKALSFLSGAEFLKMETASQKQVAEMGAVTGAENLAVGRILREQGVNASEMGGEAYAARFLQALEQVRDNTMVTADNIPRAPGK